MIPSPAKLMPIMMLVLFALSGCNTVRNLNRPVYVLQPRQSQILTMGEAFNLNAAINPTKFDFDIETVEVELHSLSTGESFVWPITPPAHSGPFTVNESLWLPKTLSPANDYLLTITAFSAGKARGQGLSLSVIVVEAPDRR
jgi:hypothetical protein